VSHTKTKGYTQNNRMQNIQENPKNFKEKKKKKNKKKKNQNKQIY
jgi:hypothetical protein